MDDSKELAAHDGGGGREIVEHQSRSEGFLSMLLRAAQDPTIDAAKVKTMADLAIQLQDRERETQFAQDFAAALMEMPYISKSNQIVIPAKDGKAERVQGSFASFENLDKVVRPILARHNMVISFKLGSDQGTTATPILTHTNGYRDVGDALKVPPDTSGSKNAAQAIGSSAQYAKRYAMCAALNIVTVGEDRDGTTYPLADDPLTDRQTRLIAEADASAADGNYDEWYKKQKPTERAWLVIKGVHARLGGKPLPELTQDERAPAPASDPPASQSESTQGEQGGQAKKKTLTPEEWVEACEREISRCANGDALDVYVDGKRDALARLEASNPALHRQLKDAISYRRDQLADQ